MNSNMTKPGTNSNLEDPLRGFRVANEHKERLASTGGISSAIPTASLKQYLSSWTKGSGVGGSGGGTGSGPTLPYSFTNPQHTKTDAPTKASNTGFTSWPGWSGPGGGLFANEDRFAWLETLGLTRTQRWSAASILLLGASLLFFLAFIRLPMIALTGPTKFVVPFCVASLMVFLSGGFWQGFRTYGRHIISSDRILYTVVFVGTTLLTLWAAVGVKSVLLTLPIAGVQMVSMIAYLISYLPGGSTGVSHISLAVRNRFIGNF